LLIFEKFISYIGFVGYLWKELTSSGCCQNGKQNKKLVQRKCNKSILESDAKVIVTIEQEILISGIN
jgi:hypothetical protein